MSHPIEAPRTPGIIELVPVGWIGVGERARRFERSHLRLMRDPNGRGEAECGHDQNQAGEHRNGGEVGGMSFPIPASLRTTCPPAECLVDTKPVRGISMVIGLESAANTSRPPVGV